MPHNVLGTKGEFRLLPRMGCAHVWRVGQKACEAKRILEYGSGGSTIWLAQIMPKSGKLVSMENDFTWWEWCEKIVETLQDVVELAEVKLRYAKTEDEYIASEQGPFDMILVDGRHIWRAPCMAAAYDKLRPGGTVFLHDSQEALYQPGIVEFLSKGGRLVHEDADRMYKNAYTRLLEGVR